MLLTHRNIGDSGSTAVLRHKVAEEIWLDDGSRKEIRLWQNWTIWLLMCIVINKSYWSRTARWNFCAVTASCWLSRNVFFLWLSISELISLTLPGLSQFSTANCTENSTTSKSILLELNWYGIRIRRNCIHRVVASVRFERKIFWSVEWTRLNTSGICRCNVVWTTFLGKAKREQRITPIFRSYTD